MQRLVNLYAGTSKLFRVVNVNNLQTSRVLFEQENLIENTNNFIIKRCLATKNKDSKGDIDVHAKLYKPSTAAQETHITGALKGGQPTQTIKPTAKNTQTGSGKVWSAQNPGGVHVAPLGRVSATTFVPKATEEGQAPHETTVYSAQGGINIADPFKTHTLQPEATPAKLAEAAAASAFQPFTPDTSSAPVTGEAVFAPKISSSDVYSSTSSPTAHFDSVVPSQPQQDTKKYEATNKPKVFGGQDTTAETKKKPKKKSI